MQIIHNNICIVNKKDIAAKNYASLVAKYQYIFAENSEGKIYPVAGRYEKVPVRVLEILGFFKDNVKEHRPLAKNDEQVTPENSWQDATETEDSGSCESSCYVSSDPLAFDRAIDALYTLRMYDKESARRIETALKIGRITASESLLKTLSSLHRFLRKNPSTSF